MVLWLIYLTKNNIEITRKNNREFFLTSISFNILNWNKRFTFYKYNRIYLYSYLKLIFSLMQTDKKSIFVQTFYALKRFS